MSWRQLLPRCCCSLRFWFFLDSFSHSPSGSHITLLASVSQTCRRKKLNKVRLQFPANHSGVELLRGSRLDGSCSFNSRLWCDPVAVFAHEGLCSIHRWHAGQRTPTDLLCHRARFCHPPGSSIRGGHSFNMPLQVSIPIEDIRDIFLSYLRTFLQAASVLFEHFIIR